MELFSQLHEQGKTIIMITHSEEIAGYADRVIKIIDGEIYENGSETVARTTTVNQTENDSPADSYAENGEVTNYE
jgi:putative ABC transport system ATP-binding protein